MVNLMQSLYTSQDALRISQAGMGVVSNNIANMNTVGYSKQRLDVSAMQFQPGSVDQMTKLVTGTVVIDKVNRYQDEFLNGFILQENSAFGYDEKTAGILKSIESYCNEIEGSGLTGALDDYFIAAQQLSTDPLNKVVRANYVSQANSVATEFNTKYEELTNFRETLVGNGVTISSLENSQTGKIVDEINNEIQQITELSRQIAVFTNQQSAQPNTLYDQRQLLLDSLATKIPITTRAEGNSLDLYVGNIQLNSDGKQVAYFKASVGDANNPAVISIVNNDATSTVAVADYKSYFTQEQGELKALLEAGGNGADSVLGFVNQLNSLAQNFAKSVNDIQLKRAYDGGGVITDASLKIDTTTNQLAYATENIFLDGDNPAPYDPTTITAANIKVNQAVKDDPFEIATAYAPVNAGPPIVPQNPNAVGNNNNALSFVTMRDTALLGGLSTEKYYYSMISDVGNNASLANAKLQSQQASLNQLNDKKQSLVGVSLDEELVDLMKYQKAYQASAQVFSAVNQMLSVIMAMGQ